MLVESLLGYPSEEHVLPGRSAPPECQRVVDDGDRVLAPKSSSRQICCEEAGVGRSDWDPFESVTDVLFAQHRTGMPGYFCCQQIIALWPPQHVSVAAQGGAWICGR